MKQKLEMEIDKALILKAARSAIRLKFSMQADRAINDILPGIEKQIDRAVALGKSYTLNISELLS